MTKASGAGQIHEKIIKINITQQTSRVFTKMRVEPGTTQNQNNTS